MPQSPRISSLWVAALAVGITGPTLACGADAPPAHEPITTDTEAAATEQIESAPATQTSVVDEPNEEGHETVAGDATGVEESPELVPDLPAGHLPTNHGPWVLGERVSIERMVLAEEIEKRLPVGEGDRFSEGQRVQLFIEASNRSETETTISVAWENTADGRRSPATTVRIGRGKVYRTRAYRTMRRAGSYRALVMDVEGEQIAAFPFTIEEGS